MKARRRWRSGARSARETFPGLVHVVACLGLSSGCGDLDDHVASHNVAYAPDGTLAVFTNDAIRLFDSRLQAETHPAVPAAGLQFQLSADGTAAAVNYSQSQGTSRRNAVRILRIPTGELVNDIDIAIPPTPPIAPGSVIGLIALSPGGDLVYAQNRAQPPDAMTRADSDSSAFRVSDGARLWGGKWLTSPMFSADGSSLFATFLPGDGRSGEFDLVSLDARTGAVQFSVDIGVDAVIADIALTGGGALIAGVTDDADGTALALWSSKDGTLIRKFPLNPGRLYGTANEGYPAFACWQDGDLCAVGTADLHAGALKVTIWRTDGTIVQTLALPIDPNAPVSVDDIAFSPDGSLVALAGDKTRVYRIADGALVGDRTFRYGVF